MIAARAVHEVTRVVLAIVFVLPLVAWPTATLQPSVMGVAEAEATAGETGAPGRPGKGSETGKSSDAGKVGQSPIGGQAVEATRSAKAGEPVETPETVGTVKTFKTAEALETGETFKTAETGETFKADEAGRAEAKPILAGDVTKRLDRYLAGRSGPVTAMVKDLTNGRRYRYHRGNRQITASSAKVQILMALLLETPWDELSKAARRDAGLMIRYSDNHAADRLWLRIGGASGFTRAGRRLGLRDTVGVPGDCVDLYCWGITRTSAEDQVRLMEALASARSPLKAKEREQVLRLMGGVVDGQDWGVSAARCRGDRVALKNGWLRRVSTRRWAVVTVGLIRGRGHDYAIAVLSEGSADTGQGIAIVEGVTTRVMRSFRACRA